jgi:RNA polymerase sigma-B factor
MAHLPLVRALARHYASCSPEPQDDLLQVGLLGLINAAQRYRPCNDKPFSCFARPHVRGAILHHLRDHAWIVRLPRRQAERLHQRDCTGECPEATPQNDALALQQWSRLNRAVSLEWLQAQGEEACHGEAPWPETGAPSPGVCSYVPTALNPGWHDCSLEQMLNLVGARQRQVLVDVVLKGWSYRRTASALGVSAPTVQRDLHKGLELLRRRLRQAPFRIETSETRRAPSVAPGC